MKKENIEIIPTILVDNFKQVKERIKKVEDYVSWIQLDIMDGVFVDNKTWPYTEGSINDLKEISTCGRPAVGWKTRTKLEAHLMVEKPKEVIDDWLEVVDRMIIHYETSDDIKEIIKRVHERKKEIGLAINPETLIDVLKPFLGDLDLVLLMTVNPGQGGQEFEYEVLEKIKALRKLWPNGNIEVDGGINPETAQESIKAGANLICAGTYIFKSKDIKQAIEGLRGY